MKYAIIRTGGKQYRISEGDILTVDRIEADLGKEIVMKDVLLYTADGVSTIGTPLVDGILVSAKLVDQVKGDKIRVAKFKAKARYRRVTGYRHSLSRIQIEKISSEKEDRKVKTEAKVEKSQQEKTSPKKTSENTDKKAKQA